MANTFRAIQFPLTSLLTLLLATSLLSAQDHSSPPNVVPQGTIFLIQLTDRIDTHKVKPGDHFHARLAEPLTAGNGATLEPGKKIRGHISAVEPGLHRRLLLSFDEMQTDHGWVPLIATVTGVPGEHGLKQLGEEGEIGREGLSKEQIAEAVIVGAGEAAARAAARSHGDRRTASRAETGAAGGALSAFESGHDLVLEKKTALELRLDRNLQVPAK
jgi:hypothetical protein